MPAQYLEVGKITNVHGVMGEVRVQPWADSPEFLCKFKTLYVDQSHWPIQVERARVHKNMVIIKFQGICDVPSALAMRNAILYIDRKDAHLPQGAFFLADIYGLEARDAQSGQVLGKVEDILTLPANNVYVIRGGERELMIPAVRNETGMDGGCPAGCGPVSPLSGYPLLGSPVLPAPLGAGGRLPPGSGRRYRLRGQYPHEPV